MHRREDGHACAQLHIPRHKQHRLETLKRKTRGPMYPKTQRGALPKTGKHMEIKFLVQHRTDPAKPTRDQARSTHPCGSPGPGPDPTSFPIHFPREISESKDQGTVATRAEAQSSPAEAAPLLRGECLRSAGDKGMGCHCHRATDQGVGQGTHLRALVAEQQIGGHHLVVPLAHERVLDLFSCVTHGHHQFCIRGTYS